MLPVSAVVLHFTEYQRIQYVAETEQPAAGVVVIGIVCYSLVGGLPDCLSAWQVAHATYQHLVFLVVVVAESGNLCRPYEPFVLASLAIIVGTGVI